MNKFKVTVTRIDEYEIEVDPNVWTKEALKEWSGVFYPIHDTEDVAKTLAVAYMRTDNYFIEGFGYVKILRSDNSIKTPLPEGKEYGQGVSVKPLSEDNDYETEIEVIN